MWRKRWRNRRGEDARLSGTLGGFNSKSIIDSAPTAFNFEGGVHQIDFPTSPSAQLPGERSLPTGPNNLVVCETKCCRQYGINNLELRNSRSGHLLLLFCRIKGQCGSNKFILIESTVVDVALTLRTLTVGWMVGVNLFSYCWVVRIS